MHTETGSGLGSTWKMVPSILEIKLYPSFSLSVPDFCNIRLFVSFFLLNNIRQYIFLAVTVHSRLTNTLIFNLLQKKCYSMVKFSTSRD